MFMTSNYEMAFISIQSKVIIPKQLYPGAPQALSHWYSEIWVAITDEILGENSSVFYT